MYSEPMLFTPFLFVSRRGNRRGGPAPESVQHAAAVAGRLGEVDQLSP